MFCRSECTHTDFVAALSKGLRQHQGGDVLIDQDAEGSNRQTHDVDGCLGHRLLDCWLAAVQDSTKTREAYNVIDIPKV